MRDRALLAAHSMRTTKRPFQPKNYSQFETRISTRFFVSVVSRSSTRVHCSSIKSSKCICFCALICVIFSLSIETKSTKIVQQFAFIRRFISRLFCFILRAFNFWLSNNLNFNIIFKPHEKQQEFLSCFVRKSVRVQPASECIHVHTWAKRRINEKNTLIDTKNSELYSAVCFPSQFLRMIERATHSFVLSTFMFCAHIKRHDKQKKKKKTFRRYRRFCVGFIALRFGVGGDHESNVPHTTWGHQFQSKRRLYLFVRQAHTKNK